jgi:hypothetical protein
MDTARATGFAFSTDPALREFDVGCWEGLSAAEVEAQYGEDLKRLMRGEDVPLGGGESYGTFSARIDGALAALRAQLEPGDHALVVCHGGVIGTVLSGAFGLRKARAWATARALNTSITELSYGEEGTLLHVFNDTLHLMPLGSWPGYGEVKGCVALFSDVPAQPGYGDFTAHYEGDALAALGPDLSRHLSELARRHPEERVAVTAASPSIHAWAETTLLGRASAADAGAGSSAVRGRLCAPPAGSICHAGREGDRVLLLDYGLMR